MADVETDSRTVAARAVGEDHVGICRSEKAVLLVVADGTGGQHGGGSASRFVVDQAMRRFADLADALDPLVWVRWMGELDITIQSDPIMGETTAIVCIIDDGRLVGGASVGDSEGLLVTDTAALDLTHGQKRKPLLGSGGVQAQPFFFRRPSGTIVLGTDGLFKYASREKITRMVRRTAFSELIDHLIDAVRLPSTGLQDDVGIVAYRTS